MLLKPILQCLVDQEPTAFHSSDANRETFSFAVNLSLDCRGNGTEPEDVEAEERAAKQQYLDFLKAALKVEFHLFQVPAAGSPLDYAGPVHSTSGSSATQDPEVLLDWLNDQKPADGPARYWTSVISSKAEVVTDSDNVTATHALRAAHAWNAPVAHRFGLTHIVRVAKDRIADGTFVILPYFELLTGPPERLPETDPYQVEDALDYVYDPKGGFGDATGRTHAIGNGITKPFLPSDIDPDFLTPDGYVKVDSDADDVRRLLVWLEERAASLMTANLGLFPHGDNAQDPEFEQLFKIGYNAVPADKPTKLNWQNESAPWYVVARLVSALDNLVIALLKPTTVTAGVRIPEGEVLAPFVTALIRRLDGAVAPDGVQLAGLIRKVLSDNSPLLSDKGKAPLVAALRHVYGLSAPAVPPKLALVDERTLVTALLEDFVTPHQEIDPKSFDYLKSIKDKNNKANTAQTVSRLLLDLEQVLHDEAGAETAIIRLIETVETGNNRFTSLLANAITSDHTLLPSIQKAVDAAWSEYRALLDGPFNGAEAIRRAAGSTFVLALLSSQTPAAGGPELTDSEPLRRIIRASEFYERRFFPPKPESNKLHVITDILLVPNVSSLPVTTQSALRSRLQRAFDAAFQPMDSLNKPNARFIPDSMPQPLPIQIAGNIDGSKVDDFAKHFNGIGVAIQRVDGTTQDSWAHANLADLGWKPMPKPPLPPDEPPPDVTGAIHPMLPALSDGRGPMFIEYQGFPFADRAHDARILDSDAEPRDPRRLFYRHDPYVGNVFPQVPRLAYGRTFQTFSFITSNAGTLPLALQLDPASPWMPTPAPPPPPKPGAPKAKPLIGKSNYQRRTAIAQMAVIENAEGSASRIGAEIAGVTPLARDYPRIALLAEPNEPAVRDFLREADGSGKMVARQNAEWRLSDIEIGGVPEKLTVRFFDRPASEPKDPSDASFEIDQDSVPGFTAISEIAINIEFEPSDSGSFKRWLHVRCGGTTLGRKRVLPDGDSVSGWLRLVLQSFNHGKATMTFASAGAQKSDNVGDPLLLLAPGDEDSEVWKKGLPAPVEIAVSTPRVGYLDFDRWFANADLRKDMFFKTDDKPGDVPTVEASVKLFEQALIAAYVMRHLDPRIAAALDRLPDPAVEQIRIELTPHDTLIEHETVLGDTHLTLSAKDELQKFGRGFATLVDKMLDAENLWKPHHERPDPIPWSPRRLLLFLVPRLEERFQFKVIVSPKPPEGQPAGSLRLDRLTEDPKPARNKNYAAIFSVTVPEGVVARMSIDALVPAAHFAPVHDKPHPSVFHAGLKQYALRELGTYLTFPSAALRVETMYDGIKEISKKDPEKVNQAAIELAARMISVKGVEKNRKYDIITSALPPGDAATRHWRLLHEIDVTTQRWRTTGRPIYHFVNPRRYRFDKEPEAAAVPHPALRLDFGADARDELAQFELEAFFDRPDIDAQTITKTLDPLPARTVLQEIYWNPESATYFRHRFRLRSRYAGALKLRSRGEAIAWPDKDPNPSAHVWSTARGWTMRVAMLADLANVKMTRPQLRALIPLTTAPGGDGVHRPAPPVAAILQEPPFARGGLADRIGTEVKTGFSFGFSYDDNIPPDATHHLEILDSRKEGGSDPRLDYRRLNEETAYGLVLRGEGPMGLTFDNVDAPAPAYPNAMFSLLPATLNGDKKVEQSFEEMFIGAAMRRYIDSYWTTEARMDADNLDGERCWWLVLKKLPAELLPQDLLCYRALDKDYTLLNLTPTATSIEVRASRLAIDGIGPSETNPDRPDKDMVLIGKVDRANVLELAVLHQPVAPKRYSASVFVTTNSADTQRGEISAPLMLASFEWSPPVKDEYGRPKPVSATISGKDLAAYPTLASAPTFIRWTRTSRDADVLHLPRIDDGVWKSDRRHVRDLVATLDGDHFSFKLNGRDDPIWLCPSTFDNPYPIHVHRHLAVISSYFLKELGRPAELFCRTALAQDKKVMVPDLGGTSPPDQIVRVVEFEMPAQILCDRNMIAPTKYKKAYFDLRSTGFNGDEPASIHLYFRIVGPPAHQRAFTRLQIHLPQMVDNKQQDQVTVPLTLTNQPQSFVVGVYLTLRQDAVDPKKSTEALAVEARLLRSDGTLDAKQTFNAATRIADPGLFVSIDATGPDGHEFWTDVSLLHSTGTDDNTRLDFNWLFSSLPPAGQPDEPAVSVSPASLNLMHEAQARVIVVSSPIPIERQ
ncbi:hypothetical protein [Bradyrhizobium sp. Cp5.3]|uniref:hypothetical protein n=1 Tax=Bradyrhizobium sp. Cp5.3 TaxID=443598 RepID=UPI000407641F|nr:hypothetical protein [Bradyrhizobium sp. Cp5.3]